MHFRPFVAIWPLLYLVTSHAYAKTCEIPAQGNVSGDDSPAIVEAFTECKKDSDILFTNTTYYIKTALSFKDLENVNIDIRGRLEVSCFFNGTSHAFEDIEIANGVSSGVLISNTGSRILSRSDQEKTRIATHPQPTRIKPPPSS